MKTKRKTPVRGLGALVTGLLVLPLLSRVDTGQTKPAAKAPVKVPLAPAPVVPTTAVKEVTPPLSVLLSERSRRTVSVPPTRASKPAVERKLELKDASGKHRFEVSLSASGWVDARALEYLSKTLRIVGGKASVRK